MYIEGMASHKKGDHMYRVSIMYPAQEGAKFDVDYYRTKHIPLAKKLLAPYGLIRTEIDRGLSGGAGQTPPYVCIGHLYFDSPDGYDRGVTFVGAALRGDIPNFTSVTPSRQISEILDQL